MEKKIKPYHFIVLAAIFLTVLLPWKNIMDMARFQWMNKNSLHINISLINPEIRVLSADPENKLLFKAEVRDQKGNPVSMAHIRISTDNGLGSVSAKEARTNAQGESLVTYSPPGYDSKFFSKGEINITLRAAIWGSSKEDTLSLQLAPVPIVLIHGYQADESSFSNMKEYLSGKGYQSTTLQYDSQGGILQSSEKLSSYLIAQKMLYLSQGFQVKRFDLIAHSMGGLVARAYTCSDKYIENNNVRKIIFISVPHKGSPWAPIGLSYFNDQTIRDLVPDNPLLTTTLPSMLNKGLNAAIQAGSILGQQDEVVSPESASLEEWNISTDVFDIGEKKLDVDSLLNGNFSENTNHMAILNNKKVFERINEMLLTDQPFPKIKSR